MTYERLVEDAAARCLSVVGAFHPTPDDRLGPARTVVLLGPGEPGFWAHVSQEPEFQDGAHDPMDRWSRRVIEGWADTLNAQPLFPFGHPQRPFLSFAMRSGRAWSSPLGMLVHDTVGLMVSYRGALALRQHLDIPEPSEQPCGACQAPCKTACPIGALSGEGYDVPACKAFVGSEAGVDCRTQGCIARRACPISKTYPRAPGQSAYHMEVFLG